MSESPRSAAPTPAKERVARNPWRTPFAGAAALAFLLAAGPALAQAPPATPAPRGPDSSLTLLPVRLAGRPIDRVTEVVGLLLEQRGLRTIELGAAPPEVPAGADLAGLAAAVGAHAKAHPVATDRVVYAEIDGTRETGLDEVRTVLADRSGTILWSERLTSKDEPFRALEAREPMTLCMLIVQRLGPQLGLTDETARAAKPGRFAALMEQRSGLPPAEERAPLADRQKAMREARGRATLVVFPARTGATVDAASAASVAALLNEAKLFAARPATDAPTLDTPPPDPNEMKMLWDLARAFRAWLKAHPQDADYALYADYVFTPGRWEAGFVHFVVCDRAGEWVVVDLRNSHHPDYQAVKPESREACDRLLAKGLGGWFR